MKCRGIGDGPSNGWGFLRSPEGLRYGKGDDPQRFRTGPWSRYRGLDVGAVREPPLRQ